MVAWIVALVPILEDRIRGKMLVFFTSVVMAPLLRSRVAVTLNSSEKEAPEKSDFELVRASTFTCPEGKSRLKKSLTQRPKSPYLPKEWSTHSAGLAMVLGLWQLGQLEEEMLGL